MSHSKSPVTFAVLSLIPALLASPVAMAAVDAAPAMLEPTVQLVRKSQEDVNQAERAHESLVHAIQVKKRQIKLSQKLVLNLAKDQKAQDRIEAIDLGVDASAKQGYSLVKANRDARSAETEKQISEEQEKLAQLEADEKEAKAMIREAKLAKTEALDALRLEAKDSLAAKGCPVAPKTKLSSLKRGLSSIWKAMRKVSRKTVSPLRSRTEKDEREVQEILKGSECDASVAVANRMSPKETQASLTASPRITRTAARAPAGPTVVVRPCPNAAPAN